MDFQQLRDKMVDEQIFARGITDQAVLEAMRNVPRHEFVPKGSVQNAYEDCPLSIGEGQTISQPYMVALMTQSLKLKKTMRVLEIGTGSGYQAAILSRLCKEVYSIERIVPLFNQVTKTIERLRYKNIRLFLGDGTRGLPDGPGIFDAIIVTAASPSKPSYLFSQISMGGRLVVPIGDRSSQMLTIFTKAKDQIVEEKICGCVFVPLIGQYGWNDDLK